MPYKAIYQGEAKPPQSVPEHTDVDCPDCGGQMHVVKSHERQTGAFVSRHFRHNHDHGSGGGGGGGRSCGESDEHIKLKSIAASKLEHIFEDNCWKCELEYTLEKTTTDADHRQADALLLFDDLDQQLGQGVAVEVQYKNKDKDKHAVARDYIENNISVVWVTPDDFGEHDMRLNEVDLRERARRAVWPEQVPRRTDWWSPTHSPEHLRWHSDGLKKYQLGRRKVMSYRGARNVSVPATFTEPVIDELRYRESDWSELFADYASDHYRLQASIPHVDSSKTITVSHEKRWGLASQQQAWKSRSWEDRFRNEQIETTADYIAQVADAESDYQRTAVVPLHLLVSASEFDCRYYVECPGCGKQCGSYSPDMTRGGRLCSCGTAFRIDTDNHRAVEVN
jgi:hypothetical protein